MKTSVLFSILLLILSGCSKSLRPQQLLADVKELSSDKYEGRKTGTKGNQKAAEYIIKRFEEIGLKSFNGKFRQSFPIKNNSDSTVGTNLIGYIQGKRDEVIVISAHYDHIGIINNQIYNGADDNASGVAGLLALAKYFSTNQPANTIVFAAFDAEEMGLLGAKSFVENPTVPLGRIDLNINLDMISRADKGEIYAAGTFHHPELKRYLKLTQNKIKLILGHDNPKSKEADWTNQSDHFAFHAKHIPFIYFGVEDHSDYHRATDDYGRINTKTFQNVVDLITHNVSELDKGIAIQNGFREKLIMKE
jgi:Zn-dependent M28 family amino/carboxypeptidase